MNSPVNELGANEINFQASFRTPEQQFIDECLVNKHNKLREDNAMGEGKYCAIYIDL